MKASKKVLVAMSGGVDSSLAAYMMKKAGYETVGATMVLHSQEQKHQKSSAAKCLSSDVADAKAVANLIGIDFHIFDFQEDFQKNVIERFIKDYEAGRTPNPCVDCNRTIKFKRFFEKAMELGCDLVVTGHYARIERDESGIYILKKGLDEKKDQSYVLYSMSQYELSHCKFPLGGFTKDEVRNMANDIGLSNANKKESQDICFVPDGNYVNFIEKYRNKKYPEGCFLDKEGNILGKHKGIIGYTIGQRKGLGLALKKPMYVISKDVENNNIILGDNSDLMTREFEAGNFNWICGEPPSKKVRAFARTRYNQKEASAQIFALSDDRVKVIFDKPQRAITKGQSAVLYDGEKVLGGGIIDIT